MKELANSHEQGQLFHRWAGESAGPLESFHPAAFPSPAVRRPDPMAGQLLEHEFRQLLANMDLRADSILSVSKFALQHGGVWAETLLRILLEEMRRTDVPSRVKFLYLVDSICQRDKARAAATRGERQRFNQLILQLLPTIVRLVLPPSTATRHPKNSLALQKVASVWASRRIFPPAALQSVRNAALLELLHRV